jgi:hypothetical protein
MDIGTTFIFLLNPFLVGMLLFLGPVCEPVFWLPVDIVAFFVSSHVFRYSKQIMHKFLPVRTLIAYRFTPTLVAFLCAYIVLSGALSLAGWLQHTYSEVLLKPFERCHS